MRLDFCVVCGIREGLEHHHVIPKSKGGTDNETNLITLCTQHHCVIHQCRKKSNSTASLTKAALQVLKDKGVKLGNLTNLDDARLLSNATNKAKANDFANNVLPIVLQFRDNNETLPAIADKLNAMGVKTRRGGKWYASTVANILKRA